MLLMLATAHALTLTTAEVYPRDEMILVEVHDAQPGERVGVLLGRQQGAGHCIPSGACFDITTDTTRLLDITEADALGRVIATVPLTADPGAWYVQAISVDQPTVSSVHALEILDPDADDDADGVNNRHEFWANTPRDDADADDDGVLDGDDLWPWTPSTPSTWVADDLVISDRSVSVPDPEFDAVGYQATWQDRDGLEVWVADIDPQTGAMSPPDGRGTLIAEDVLPLSAAKNGPEWLQTSLGPIVVYAKRRRGMDMIVASPPSLTPWRKAWLTEGYGPIGSLDPGDPNPRVLFTRDFDNNDLVTRVVATGFDLDHPQPIFSARWIAGRDELVGFIADADGNDQVAEIDPYTGAYTLLTQTPAYKRHTFAWTDPELAQEVFFTSVGLPRIAAPTALEVYLSDGAGGWALHDTIQGPPSHPFIVSPEPFVYNGRSYISFLASKEPQNFSNGDAEVWLVDIDPATQFARRLSGGTNPFMKDPEPIVFENGEPFVFYTEIDNGNRIIHRCALGL